MWFRKRLVREIADKNGRVVFRRWRVITTKWFSLYVHAIYDRDKDIFLHDHPWNFISLILKGGYQEDYAFPSQGIHNMTRWRRPGSIRRMEGIGEYHRIRRLINGTCWSLVLTGARENQWGYLTPSGWVHNKEYRRLKNLGLIGELFDPSKTPKNSFYL